MAKKLTDSEIMQLPDEEFGQRWPLGMYCTLSDANPVFDIVEAPLPEKTIIWEIQMSVGGSLNINAEIIFAIGDQLPTSDAEFFENEILFRECEGATGNRGGFIIECLQGKAISKIKVMLNTAGRRLIMRAIRVNGVSVSAAANVIISSVPTKNRE